MMHNVHHIYGASEMRLGELCSSNPLRIPHPKIDKLACQAQGAGIFAVGEISLRDANCIHFWVYATELHHILWSLMRCSSMSFAH